LKAPDDAPRSRRTTPGRGVASACRGTEDASSISSPDSMSQSDSPNAQQPESFQGLTRAQKMALLQEELIKLNAQLEYLRLMLKLRPPK
jgi:hypothetical protein